MKKKIIINFLLLLVVVFIIEGFCCFSYYLKTKKSLELKNNARLLQNFRYTAAHKFSSEYYSHLFTEHKASASEKRPVLFLGCSYTKGSGIDEEETLAYKIHKLTNRDVYKRGIPAGGIQLALDMFDTGDMKKDVPDAEYIIYTYISYHLARLYAYQLDYIETEVNQRYKLKNGKLVKIKQPKYPQYYSLFFVKQIQKTIERITSKNEYTDYKLFNAVMAELLEQAKKTYKDVKFVVLLYPSADYIENDESLIPEHEIEKLKSMGFIVINAEDLTKEPIRTLEYRIADKDHPSGKAWEAIAPALVKALNL